MYINRMHIYVLLWLVKDGVGKFVANLIYMIVNNADG